MTGNGRNLTLVQSWPGVDETVWVPVWVPPAWRDDERDLKPTDDTVKEAS